MIATTGTTTLPTYYPWLLEIAAGHRGDVLDVGCGDGLLAQRLAPETRNVGVVVTDPQERLDEIRRTVDEVLPGASVRRTLYYRYLLRWKRS